MENGIFLLNMAVKGIKNIEKEVKLDFYKKTVDKNFNPEKYRIKAIYGENGSGKTAIISAVKIFQDIILRGNYLSESRTQKFLDEIINKKTQKFRFQCEFLYIFNDEIQVIYQYEILLGKNKKNVYEIQSESLKMKSGNYLNNNYIIIFEVRDGELLNIKCDEEPKEIFVKKTMNLLPLKSFVNIVMVNMEDDPGFLSQEFKIHFYAFSKYLLKLDVYLGEEDQHKVYVLRKVFSEMVYEKEKLTGENLSYQEDDLIFFSINENKIKKSYFDIYEEKISQLTEFIKLFKKDLVSIDIDKKENGEYYLCDLNLNYGDYLINKEFESTGIKKLIRLFDCLVLASNGGIVFIDEMDSNLNDVYLCKMVEYFMYYGKGQLCFTTHNLDPMSVLKKNRNSIDFLSSDNHLVSWKSRGNATPENCYKNGMIEDLPFNIDASDFVGIIGG